MTYDFGNPELLMCFIFCHPLPKFSNTVMFLDHKVNMGCVPLFFIWKGQHVFCHLPPGCEEWIFLSCAQLLCSNLYLSNVTVYCVYVLVTTNQQKSLKIGYKLITSEVNTSSVSGGLCPLSPLLLPPERRL